VRRVNILSLTDNGVITNITLADGKMKRIEMDRKRNVFSALVGITIIVSLAVNIFLFGPTVIIGKADSGDNPDIWYNSTTLNVTVPRCVPRILWYDNQSETWVSRLDLQNDMDGGAQYRFIIVNISSDQGWDIQFVNITAWYNQEADHSTDNQTLDGSRNLVPQYFWDTTTNSKTPVHHSVGTIIDTVDDPDAKTTTLTVSVEKVNWTYIEVTDLYPDDPDLIVKTADGRTISSEMIWRKDGKIFFLDDPVTEYLLIYSYAEGFLFDVKLELTPDSTRVGETISVLITLLNVGEPGLVNGTVNYTLYKGEEIVWSSEENASVLGQKTYTKTISTDGLSPGSYVNKVIYSYAGSQTASAQGIFAVDAIQQPLSENILLWTLIIITIIIMIAIISVLVMLGYISFNKKKK
jgi:hypothetical protein